MKPKTALKALARTWGVREDAAMHSLHTELVAAIRAGQPTRELWGAYFDAVEPQVDFPSDGPRANQARAARDIRKALIWIEAGEVVNGLCDLLFAETVARDEGYRYEERRLGRAMNTFGSQAEYLQAKAYFAEDGGDDDEAEHNYGAAGALYIEADNDHSIIGAQRGLIQHHLAECYLGLLRLGAGNAAYLQQQIVANVESAAAYRAGTPGAPRTQSLLDQLEQESWWAAAVERQQS